MGSPFRHSRCAARSRRNSPIRSGACSDIEVHQRSGGFAALPTERRVRRTGASYQPRTASCQSQRKVKVQERLRRAVRPAAVHAWRSTNRFARPATANAQRFPPERAFVVQLSAAERDRKPTRGRVEHVVSGRSMRFESLDALAEFFGEVLALARTRSDERRSDGDAALLGSGLRDGRRTMRAPASPLVVPAVLAVRRCERCREDDGHRVHATTPTARSRRSPSRSTTERRRTTYLTWDNFVPDATIPPPAPSSAGNGHLLGYGPAPGAPDATERSPSTAATA